MMSPLKWLLVSMGWALGTTCLLWVFNVADPAATIIPALGLIYPVIFTIISIYYAWIKNPLDRWKKK